MIEIPKIYFTSDLHLFHKNIIDYENRPFNGLADMHEALIRNWNKKICSCDKVYILGDLTFGNKIKSEEIIQALNGKKFLVKGNHDNHPNQWYRDIGITEVYDYPILFNNYFICSHEPMLYLKAPFCSLYGHVHSSVNFNTVTRASVCVCVERWNYEPVSLFTIERALFRCQNITNG